LLTAGAQAGSDKISSSDDKDAEFDAQLQSDQSKQPHGNAYSTRPLGMHCCFHARLVSADSISHCGKGMTNFSQQQADIVWQSAQCALSHVAAPCMPPPLG